MQNKTVVVGMSGGVDSSVAALLLKEQGYNVIGLFMVNWNEEDDNGVCTSVNDYEDVKRVCNTIGIPYFTVNYAKEYWDKVFEYFLQEYKKGRTPNPDVLCNREIKFGPFLEQAKKIGADYIATGHYAKVYEKDGLYYLAKSKDKNKDQTYFLNQLSQEQLKNTLFPLADIEKPDLRKIAQKHNFVNAGKKDSTGVCFIGERHFRQFLKQYIPMQKGDIVDTNNKVVGKHDGVYYYTIGQRRGLNIGGMSTGNGKRWYVIGKDVEKNILYVSQGEGEELYSKGLVTYKVNWIPKEPANKKFDCFAKFRYRQPDQSVSVEILKDKVLVHFKEKQRAVTEGQFVVFYDKDENCLGGGVIEEVIK